MEAWRGGGGQQLCTCTVPRCTVWAKGHILCTYPTVSLSRYVHAHVFIEYYSTSVAIGWSPLLYTYSFPTTENCPPHPDWLSHGVLFRQRESNTLRAHSTWGVVPVSPYGWNIMVTKNNKYSGSQYITGFYILTYWSSLSKETTIFENISSPKE